MQLSLLGKWSQRAAKVHEDADHKCAAVNSRGTIIKQMLEAIELFIYTNNVT